MWLNWVDIGASSIVSMTHSTVGNIEAHIVYCPTKGSSWMWWVEADGERLCKPQGSSDRDRAKAGCLRLIEQYVEKAAQDEAP